MSHFVYLALAGENRIALYDLDPDTGKLALRGNVGLGGGPGPLCVDPTQRYLHAALRSAREIVSFAIDPGTGALTPIGAPVTLEAGPCYLSTDRRGRFLLSAYYGAGVVAVHPIGEDGAARSPHVQWFHTAPKAHCVQIDASNRYAFVPHVGESNAIFQFQFDAETGRLKPNAVPKVEALPETGPRHFVFHPRQPYVYADNEQASSVTAYRFHAGNGTLEPFQTLSTLPDGYAERNSCAQIQIHPSGRFVYASNRGHDSIAAFEIDEATGHLTALGQQATEKTPRAFNVDPDGRYLFAGGQGTGRLASYRISPERGTLEPLTAFAVGENPMWVLPLKLGA